MPATISPMIEEEKESETNGTTEVICENGVSEVQANGNGTKKNVDAITSKLQEMMGLLDSFKSHHHSPSPEEKIELLKLSTSIGSKILEL